ncbi:ABC transporter permease [Pleionea sediminis]|uniref:ABC transporter permease n=1 Tax=Pleionea sediminis TaxID=2569479 RepID=UPI001184F0ED|nr:FtsX-like permease family protein [Pleionea sediminis]
MLSFSLAWKLFWRDWKSGELRILIFALWVAIGGLTAVTLLVDRIDRGMTKEASQVLGADLVISGPRPIKESIKAKAESLGLQTSDLLWFSSVVVSGDKFQLSSVRAVDNAFPLAGDLKISDRPFTEGEETKGAPKPGTVWLSPRLLNLLSVEVGGQIQLGVSQFTVAGVIITEPGGSSFFNFSPTIMMNRNDVAATKVVQPGSRLNYRLALSGDESDLKAFDSWVGDELNTSQRKLGAMSGAPQLGSALGRAKNYLNLSGVLGLLLGGIAIAIAANRYANRHFDHSALLRCMGLKKNQVLTVFCLVLLMSGFTGALIGSVTGYFINEGLIVSLADLLPEQVPPPRTTTFLISIVTGLTVLIGFALPALIRIRSVQPMRILRRDLEPLKVSNWVSIGFAIVALALVLYWYAQNLKLVVSVIVGGGVLVMLCLAAANGLLKVARRWSKSRSIAVKFGIEHLDRHKSASLIQISAFGLTLTLILTILLLRNELIEDWKAQLPQDAPNHFLVNIQAEEVKPLQTFFEEQQIKASDVYPMVRGRVTQINEKDPKEMIPEGERGHNSLRRELNLTWSSEFPEANQLIEGEWDMGPQAKPVISVEDRMASALGLSLGDSLTFTVGSDAITAEITSIREIEWDSFQPNFYVIFNEGALDSLPSTYITSFYMAPEQKLLLNDLVEQFPTQSVIELDVILNEVRKVLDKASLAVEVVLVFVILAGLAVLFATTRATLDEKLYESAILKTLGAGRSFVRKTTLVEYWVLGILSGGLAAVATEGLAFVLYHFIFKMPPEFHWWIWVGAPLAGLLMVVPAGSVGNRKVLSLPPIAVLNES